MDTQSPPSNLLETERLILRPLEARDAPGLLALYSLPEVTAYIDTPVMTQIADAEGWIARQADMQRSGAGLRWGVFDRESGDLIGSCGFHHWDPTRYRAEISYDLSPRFWGQGYMREALLSVLAFGFEQMGIHRIEAMVDPDDTRSQNLLYGLGFEMEGILRDHDYLKGRFQDDMMFALLEQEWKITHLAYR
ncbi:MAG: GNAT family protein [Chloroflexota bacterium]